MILGFGEMLKEDRPSEDIWMNDEALVEHFKAREMDRERQRDNDDYDSGTPDGAVISNRLADDLLKKAGVKPVR